MAQRQQMFEEQAMNIQRQLGQAVAVTNQFAGTVIARFDRVEDKVETAVENLGIVEEKLDTVVEKVGGFEIDLKNIKDGLQSGFENNPLYGTIMPPMASLFNTKSGVCARCPVIHTDESTGETFRVEVLNMPFLINYHSKGRPDAALTDFEVRRFLMSLPQHKEIPYRIFCDILAQTMMAPRQVSKQESFNRLNYLMIPLDDWLGIEAANEQTFTARARTLVERKPKKPKQYAHYGNSVAYTQGGPDDSCSGFVASFERTFSREEQMSIPSQGRTWTKEMLMKRAIIEAYQIPENQWGRCHVVGGKCEPAVVKTHEEAFAADKKNIENAMKRRLKRAEVRGEVSRKRKR